MYSLQFTFKFKNLKITQFYCQTRKKCRKTLWKVMVNNKILLKKQLHFILVLLQGRQNLSFYDWFLCKSVTHIFARLLLYVETKRLETFKLLYKKNFTTAIMASQRGYYIPFLLPITNNLRSNKVEGNDRSDG